MFMLKDYCYFMKFAGPYDCLTLFPEVATKIQKLLAKLFIATISMQGATNKLNHKLVESS